MSSSMSVPVPSGHGRAISYGWLPDAHVPVSRSSISFTLKRTSEPRKSPAPISVRDQ